MWNPTPPGANPQNLSRKIQALVREARLYPPERESRIVRDALDCCRHFQGLRPDLQTLVFDASQSLRLLALDGVIPIQYRNVTYQIPVCIWVMPHYPNEAPVPYVRPTSAMVIRERHSHVDKEGRVYLPYLSNWDPTQFSFYGVVVAMIRVFCPNPPVVQRPTQSVGGGASDEVEKRQLIVVLSKRIRDRLVDANEEAAEQIGQLLHKKEQMIKSDENATEEMRQKATAQKEAEDEVEMKTKKLSELEEWVKSVGSVGEEREIDDMLRFVDVRQGQLVECSAEDMAYTDALDQVDEALVHGVIDQDTYIMAIRKLSREQFFARALRRKIEMAEARKGVEGDSVPRRLATMRTAPMYAS